MIEEKIKIIDRIVKRHPATGVEKGWSWYVGGMRDTGDWYYRKMLDVPIEELTDFLVKHIADGNKPPIEYTAQEIEDMNTFHNYQGITMSVYQYKQINKFREEADRKIWFGE